MEGDLVVSNVTKAFVTGGCRGRRNAVLDDVSFTVKRGSVVGLMGLTGSGKTTLCKLIQHELRPDGGSITYGGVDLAGPYASLHNGMVASCPQDKTNVMFNASVADNIRVCREYIAWTDPTISLDEYVDLLLTKLKLKAHQHKKYHQLSGGMQRRLSLLIALLRTPHVLILDEITANVDPQLKHDIWNILKDYQQMFSRTIIMTSHDSYELQYICAQVVHIDNKHVLLDESVNDFVRRNLDDNHRLQINNVIYKGVGGVAAPADMARATTQPLLTETDVESQPLIS